MTAVDLKALQPAMTRELKGFAAEPTQDWSEARGTVFEPGPAAVPAPPLVLIALHHVMGFKVEGPFEKVRWSISCAFAGRRVYFEWRKFGFTVMHQHDSDDVKMMMGRLTKGVRLIDKYLQDFAKLQCDSGNVTLGNDFYRMDGRYRFFREKANEAYVRPDEPMKPTRWDESGRPIGWSMKYRQGEREGFYYTVAMLDAYFSRLEHLLVLLLPFTKFTAASGALLKFIGTNWDGKFKTVVDIVTDPVVKGLYDRLKAAKERFRNPLSHGGFEKDRASLHFHLPGVGVLPAALTGYADTLQFEFLPVDHGDHKELCALFDELDAYFENGPTRLGFKYVNAGLDVAFDAKTMREYADACVSEEELEHSIRYWSATAERHANMDY